MKKKTTLFALCAVLLTPWISAEAQQPGKVARIGFLTGGGNTFSFEAFRHGLKDFGYKEGENILIEYRSADGHLDRIPDQVAELVRLKVDILVTTSPGVRPAKRATKTILIVMITQEDPIASGLCLAWRGRGKISPVSHRSRAPQVANGWHCSRK